MKTTKEQIIKKSRISKKEKEIALTYDYSYLTKGVTIYPVTRHGSGRWSRNYRSLVADKEILNLKNSGIFNYKTGNNAPRKGATGEYHEFTPKIRRLGIARKIKNLEEAHSQEMKKLHKEVLEEERKKFQTIVESLSDSDFNTVIENWKKAVEIYGNPYWAAQKLNDNDTALIKNLYEKSNMSWRELFNSL